MTDKFKIGETVNYRPAARTLRETGGTYTVTGFLPVSDGQATYRIKHFSEEHERVAWERAVVRLRVTKVGCSGWRELK